MKRIYCDICGDEDTSFGTPPRVELYELACSFVKFLKPKIIDVCDDCFHELITDLSNVKEKFHQKRIKNKL